MSGYLQREGVDVTKTRAAHAELAALNAKYGELATDAALAAGGALPPPFGTAADVASLGRSLWKGDWGGALLDVAGLVPIVGDGAKGAKIANRLNDLRKSLDVAQTGMQRAFGKTQAAARKYWDDAIKSNKTAYEEALKACNGSKACREAAAAKKGPQYKNTPTSGKNGEWVSGERGDGVWKPANGGPSITYKDGFPNYGPHSKGDVQIPMRGNTSSDFRDADAAMRDKLGDPNWQRPRDHTWHHNEDGTTMQLIPKNVHATGGGASTPHMGGASLYDGSNATQF